MTQYLKVKICIPNLKLKIILFLLVLLGTFSCNIKQKSGDYKLSTQSEVVKITNESQEKNTEESKFIEGKISKSRSTEWKITKSTLAKEDPISNVFFINKETGWAVNKRNLFKTLDSGETWEQTAIDFIEDASIKSLFFSDNSRGWLVIEDNESKYSYSVDDKIKVFRTNDGGKKWSLIMTETSMVVTDTFFSREEAWIIGKKFIGYSPLRLTPVLLHYSETTNEWHDVSDKVKMSLLNEQVSEEVYPILEKIFSTQSNCVILVTDERRLLQSCDKGDSWKLITKYDNELTQLGIKQIDETHNFIRIVEGKGGVEGDSSRITIIPTGSQNGEMKILYANKIIFEKGLWISNEEFLVFGTKFDYIQNKKDGIYDKVRNSVILFTNDGGVTWSNIYQSNIDRTFIFYFIVDPTLVWTIDNSGILYKFTKI